MIINYEELGFQRIAFDPMNPIKLKYNVKQSDTKSRGFYVQVIQANELMPPSAGDILTFFAKKPDNTEVFVTAEIRNGEYVIALPNQIFSIPGSIETEITLQGGNLESITLKGPTINVVSTFSTDAIESADDFTALSQALSQVASILGEVEDIRIYAENLSLSVGNMEDLSTEEKNSVVLAINELQTRMGELLNAADLENLLINKVDNTTLGVMSGLLTEHQETIVGAMNELKAGLEEVRLSTSAEELIGIFTSKADKTMIGDMTLLGTEVKDNIVGAINEVVEAISGLYQGLDTESVELMIEAKVGDITLLPTTDKTNLVSAIIEFNSAITEIQSVTDVATLTALISGKANKSDLTALSSVVDEKVDNADFYANIEILENQISDKVDNTTFNEAMSGVHSGTDEAAVNALIQNVSGDLTTLTTTEKSSIVGAINEVNSRMSDEDIIGIANMKVDNAAFQMEVERIDAEFLDKVDNITLGNPETLQTMEKVIVNAINEIYGALGGTVATGDIATILLEYAKQADLEVVDEKVGDLSLLNTAAKTSLVNAINDLVGRAYGSVSGTLNTGEVTITHNKQVNASNRATASGDFSQVNASYLSTVSGKNSQANAVDKGTASGELSQVNAGTSIKATGKQSQVNASSTCEASGLAAQINTSASSKAMGGYNQINGGSACETRDASFAQINMSKSVLNNVQMSSAWGYHPTDFTPLTANIKILLESITGNIKHAGVLSSGHGFTDYAEIFPNITGAAQEPGLIQTIDNTGKYGYGVRPANEGEDVVGVISAMAGVILGDTPFAWQGRWLKDEWGAFIMHDVEVETGELDEEGNPIMETVNVPMENPDFDPSLDFHPRADRPEEWSVVGMVGQVYVRVKEDVAVLDYVKPWINGVGQTSVEQTGLKVMKITKEYDAEKGYAIAFCLLK